MTDALTIDAVARALSDALAAACGARLGGEATAAPSELPSDTGWLLALPVSGSLDGRLTVWFEQSSARACARAIAGDAEPADEAIDTVLTGIVHAAATDVVAQAAFAGVVFGAPAVTQATPPAGARAVYVAVPNTASCLFAVAAGSPAASAPRPHDDRLGAVLDVDLPLVVRFGQTVMPLRELAALGPGSVIDMGRAPDEPVELLVGEKLLARGDVVVVGGNYGVRITELAAGRGRAARKETAAS
jgi:flagellar motor switch protein FliN/FliY